MKLGREFGLFLVSATVLVLAAYFAMASVGSDLRNIQSKDREDIRVFLTKTLFKQQQPSSFSFQSIDLNGDGSNEVVVYVSGKEWCGSGGCLLLVLKRTRTTFTFVGRTTITWPPIRVLDHKTNGWRDITVRVQGGGIIPGYEAVLAFDGKHYPTNPTVPPAHPALSGLPGQVLSDIGN